MKIKGMFLLGALLWGTGISMSERTDDWWLNPRVETTVEYRPYLVPSDTIGETECKPRAFYLAPWVIEFRAEISAYNSEPGQTDDSPFIAANNRDVFEGGIATNAFPCGTQLMIPDLFGETVFTVNDRMNLRYHPLRIDGQTINLDVWMVNGDDARNLGRKTDVPVVVVSYAGA